MGEAGRRRVEGTFDIRRMVADYEALYDELFTGGTSVTQNRDKACPTADGA